VPQRQTHQIQGELESSISVSSPYFKRLVSGSLEGRVGCVCISFVVMGGRSDTQHLQETVFCLLSCWLSPSPSAVLFVPGNSDSASSVIFWMSSLSLCLKPSSSGNRGSLAGGSRICSFISPYLLLSLVLICKCTTIQIQQMWSCFLVCRSAECRSFQKSGSSRGS